MTWWHVAPSILLAMAVLVLPGLLVGAAAGLRREPWLGLSPLLSLVAVATAIPVSSALQMRWGVLAITLATVLLAVVLGVGWLLARQLLPARLVLVDPRVASRTWRGDTLVFGATVAVGALWVAAVAVHAIGDVSSVQQSFDGVFHVNAIQRVAHLGSASPATVSATSTSVGGGGFYPPLFHAVAGLVAASTGVSAIVAANVVAVVCASVLWVTSMGMLGHVVLPRHRYGVLSCVVAASVIPLFPYLLLRYGVLWPNLMSICVLPAVLALVAVVMGQAETVSVPWVSALVIGLLSAFGLYYAHPGAVFATVALALPIALTAVVRGLAVLWRTRRFGPLWVLVVVLLGWMAVHEIWTAILQVPQLKSTMKFDWPALMNMAQALGMALGLESGGSPASWVLGCLVVLGVVRAAREPHQRWLILAHALVVYLFMLAAGTDESISQELTGFWYNDPYRLAALLPVTAAPLVAIGLVWCRDRLLDAFSAWHAERPHSERHRLRTDPAGSLAWQWGLGLAVLAALLLALPGHLTLTDDQRTVALGYYPEDPTLWLVDHDEASLYKRELTPAAGDTATTIGNPWNGASLAGPIAGRTSVLGHLVVTMDPDRQLLAQRFHDLGTDPAVCRAVHRLDVGYATEDTRLFWPNDDLKRPQGFPGLDHLEGRRGLTPIGYEGTVTVYRVSC